MIDHEKWIKELLGKLQKAFGDRLLFFGLQGSYLRGEAHEGSDIDAMTVLDELSHEDLKTYRDIVRSMDRAELACGFICGREEMKNWPRYEIIPLLHGTKSLYGDLFPLLPEAGEEDLKDHIRISAANLYHEVCHRYLYSEEGAEGLQGCYKSTFFILQALYLFRTGCWFASRSALRSALNDEEAELLCRIEEWDILAGERAEHPDGWFKLLELFCKQTLKEVS